MTYPGAVALLVALVHPDCVLVDSIDFPLLIIPVFRGLDHSNSGQLMPDHAV
jgi:hypothetical protein